MPKVSVIIPCYNLGVYLDEAVSSVLAQTFTDFEILVVNDGSTDPDTCRILAEYSRPKTQVIHTENMGVSAARNRGIEEATGKYILPLDADDRIAETYIEQAVSVLDEREDVGIVYCHGELFGERCGAWNIPEFSLPHHLLDNLIFSTALYRREDWLRVGGYDDTMTKGWEDWEFWIRLLSLGYQTVRLPETLFSYRIRRGSREQSLVFPSKFRIFARIIGKNRSLYLSHIGVILRILLSGSRRRPDEIKVDHV